MTEEQKSDTLICESNIKKLISEVEDSIDPYDVYCKSFKYVDIEGIKKAEAITNEDLAATFAWAGFLTGIRFALENLTMGDEDE